LDIRRSAGRTVPAPPQDVGCHTHQEVRVTRALLDLSRRRFGDRQRIVRWKAKLLAFTKAATEMNDSREWIPCDIAMIESGISGMLASRGNASTEEFVIATLRDILESEGNAPHWRNREARRALAPGPDIS
jgi:hypothetical protein